MNQQSLCADDLKTIDKYSNMVYRMAYSLVKNKYDAEDIHQEVFVRYIIRKPQFEDAGHEKAWFLRVTINLCKNLWKTAWKQKVVAWSDDLDETEMFEESEQSENEIIEIVKLLPQKYRVVIHLFYYEELSIEEISGVLQMKPATVRTHLTRARAKLKKLLEEQA